MCGADLQLLLTPERTAVADKTQYFADYNANAQKVRRALCYSHRAATLLHQSKQNLRARRKWTSCKNTWKKTVLSASGYVCVTKLRAGSTPGGGLLDNTSTTNHFVSLFQHVQLNGRVERFTQAAYTAADAVHQMLAALESCPLPADNTAEPPHLVMKGQRPIPSIAANLVPPGTLQFVEAARERVEVEAEIAELVSSIGRYVGLGVEEGGGKEAALGGGLAESDGASSCDGEDQRRGSN